MADNQDLYWILSRTEVYETDGISSELHLSQDGHDLVHVQERSELHLREDDDTLKVYVPRDPKTQGFCYFSALPRRIMEWMMMDPATFQTKTAGSRAIQVVTSVLNAPIINMTQILEAEGIVDVEIPEDIEEGEDKDALEVEEEIVAEEPFGEEEEPAVEVVEEDDPDETLNPQAEEDIVARYLAQPEIHEHDVSSDDEDSVFHQFADMRSPPRWGDLPVRQRSPATSNSSITGRRLFTPASSTTEPPRQNRRTSNNAPQTPSVSATSRLANGQPQPRPATQPAFVFGSSPAAQSTNSAFQFQGLGGRPEEPTIDDDAEYSRLVSNVISAAGTARFPSKGAYDMSGLFGALPDVEEDEVELSRRFRSRNPLERDMKIGALGELFVSNLFFVCHLPLTRDRCLSSSPRWTLHCPGSAEKTGRARCAGSSRSIPTTPTCRRGRGGRQPTLSTLTGSTP